MTVHKPSTKFKEDSAGNSEMKIAIPKERAPGETRVAASPDAVKKFVAMGFDVVIEKGAGDGASMTDTDYQEAGATLAKDEASALKDADVILKI